MCGSSLFGNREVSGLACGWTPRVRIGKARSRNRWCTNPRSLTSVVVAVKPANNAERSAAEPVEPRTGTKGNANQQSTRRAQGLLANVYLHYVFDLWAERWRRREATGDMIMVRYADDLVVGFQHETDARRFWDDMRERLRAFSLTLHPEKTRLIEFGRFAAQNCERRGLGKPETFKFLGFVFISGKSRRGDFQIRRKSRGDRMMAKLREIKEALRERKHVPVPEVGKWLAQVVAGYFAYHAVPTNSPALSAFRYHVVVLWHRQLCRRSQRARVAWERMAKLADEFLPKPRVLHPWPSVRFAVKHPR